jgi:hypothetical protein
MLMVKGSHVATEEKKMSVKWLSVCVVWEVEKWILRSHSSTDPDLVGLRLAQEFTFLNPYKFISMILSFYVYMEMYAT